MLTKLNVWETIHTLNITKSGHYCLTNTTLIYIKLMFSKKAVYMLVEEVLVLGYGGC